MSKRQINIDIIQAFSGATVDTFNQMLSTEPSVLKPYLKGAGERLYGVSGIIGLGGENSGIVVMTLPEVTACKSVGEFVGMPFDMVDADVIDGVKEFVNIIVGAAKSRLAEKGYQYDLGLPKIILGDNYINDHGSDSKSIVVPFESKFGDFSLDISMKKGAASRA